MAVASIDIEGLSLLVLRLDAAASSLRSACGELGPRARALHVPVSSLGRIAEIAAWAEGELPGLRRRLDLALVADASRPPTLRGPSVEIVEPVLDATRAQAVGRALGVALVAVDLEAEDASAQLRAVLDGLREHLGDPDVMSGFYAELGAERTEGLAHLVARIAARRDLRDRWAVRGARHLEVLGRGFATALHDSDPPDDFADLVTAFARRTDGHERAWGRLALLQHGPVPTDHLVRFVRANALDQLVGEPLGDLRGDVLDGRPAMVGLPPDRLELAFRALASDPDASRRAISAGAGTATMVERVHRYDERLGVRAGEAFGAALAAGAGVGDPAGARSPAAAFAFDAITAVAGQRRPMWFARDHYAAIAAAWAPEILAGATAEVSRVATSGRVRPEGWEDIPGFRPRFYLSLEDTRAFLEKFGHTDAVAAPFDQAVGELYHELMAAAVRNDARKGGRATMDEVATRLGNLAGVQYVAQHHVRAGMDADDQQVREVLGTAAGLAVDHVLAPSSAVGTLLWEASKVSIGGTVDEWAAGNAGTSRTAGLEQRAVRANRLQEAAIAALLVAEDPRHAATLPASLRASDGGLLDPATVMGDPALEEAFATWLTSTNVGGDERSTYDVVTASANSFRGGFQAAQDALKAR